MQQAPLVSVITPTYNHEAYIAECIGSVLAQDYQDWEMIIVDDGSTDHTWDLINSFADQDTRIRPFRQENQGIWRLSNTYNFALGKSSGKLIAILEGDDYWPNNKLSYQVPHHTNHDKLIMSHGRVGVVSLDQPASDYCTPPIRGQATTTQYLRWALLCQSCIMPVSVIVDRVALLQIRGFHQDPGFPAVDFSTWLRLFELPGLVTWLDQLLGYWRQSNSQVTQRLGIDIAESTTRIAIERYRNQNEKVKDQLDITEKTIIKIRSQILLLPAYLIALRTALRNNDQKMIRHYSKKLIYYGSMKRKLQGLYALTAYFFRLDYEKPFSLYEKFQEKLKNRK